MKQKFIPAARFTILNPLYDGFIVLFFSGIFKGIANTISPKPEQEILDIGCGPGNMIIKLHQLEPRAKVTGLDIDQYILKIARRKLEKANIHSELIQASATQIPFTKEFDIVMSTLMFHHLTLEQKKQMLQEVFRLLKKGGKFYLYDFAPYRNKFEMVASYIYGLFEHIEDGIQGRYKSLLEEAGFKNVKSVYRTFILEMLEAEK